MQRSYRLGFLFFGTIAALASCLLVLFLIGGPALAAPGALDPTFGGDGRVTTDVRGGNSEQGQDVAVQSDGKVIVAGYTGSGSTRDFALARYNANGTPDASFGSDVDGAATGTETTDFFGGEDWAYSVAVQPDKKIVVGGYAQRDSSTLTRDFALVRLNANGTLDTNFGTGGKVTTDFAAKSDMIYDVAIHTDGKIVAAGTTATAYPSYNDVALARYNENGSLDTSFGSGGKATADVRNSTNVAYGVAIQANGSIVTAGYTGGGPSGYDFALTRHNANGTPDASFGSDVDGAATGTETTDFFGTDDTARSVALESDGKIVAAGYARTSNDAQWRDFALARYNANGTLDTSFHGDGRATTDFFGNYDEAYSVAVQPDGKIVAAGDAYKVTSNPSTDLALARYSPNGSLDTTFDTDGKVTTDFFNPDDLANDDRANSVAVQPDGKIVAAGYAYDTSGVPAFALARYDGGTQTSTDTTAPKVTAKTPVGTGVQRNTPLTATFSEAMKPITISKSSFKLYKVTSTGTTQVTNVTVRLSSNGLTATLDPFGTSATLLSSNTKYKAVVTSGAQDLANNALDQTSTKAGDQPASWTFTTGTR